MSGKNWGRMFKIFVLVLTSLYLLGCASSEKVADDNTQWQPSQTYYPPKVEDTPYFQRLRKLVEADGFLYNRYETGTGLIVWGSRARASKGYGNKDEGIKRLPAGDASKAYYISWAQYFSAFSELHKISFEDETVREIKRAVDKIVLETDYDYASLYTLPGGSKWVFSPGVLLGTDDDYTNSVIEKVSVIPGVKEVKKVSSSSGNHSWNEVVLNDNRVLFIDAAWYDTNGYSVDSSTGNYIVDNTPHYFPTMFTFDKELFSLGRTHYGWGDALVMSGKASAAQTVASTKAAKTKVKAEKPKKAEKAPKKDNSKDKDKDKEKKDIDFDIDFVLNIGKIYINGWAENAESEETAVNKISLGLPVQLGIEFTFNKFAVSALADAGAGIGFTSVEELTNPVVEWYYGGLGEFYILNKRIGIAFGGGMIDSYVWELFSDMDIPDELSFLSIPDVPTPDKFFMYYLRAGVILRGKKHKLTVYAQYFENKDIGLGLMWN